MAFFKCKMCGGDLEIAEGVTIAECEYCGTKQTVPKAMDENLQNLFNRANTLRIKSEFDKAEKIYEKIIQADSTQSEAYWGLILCKYGIEYVDDPKTFKKIPTCHRASYDSIIADDDYKSAIANSDLGQRLIYEDQAKEIDRIQRDILALAQKEEKYDVFICYKETDANGKRTQDSVIANDIYYQLKQEGFKVFYAAITLEGKLGSAYEPIIFAALNSAKVMLVIGTKPEYFNAVWVKNEWSRYLNIIKKDRSKLLIPCYRDMDAYELPEEFAHLQAQDMSKIGFINDVVRGIKKVVIKKDEPKVATVVKETVVQTANANIDPLLKRAFMFLEDGDWKSANDYCEKVLDQDPENAMAYVGKLMAELYIRYQDDLQDCKLPFDSKDNYKKAIRFGDEKLKDFLIGCIEHIKKRNEKERLEKIYSTGQTQLASAQTESEYKEAAKTFNSIKDYLDSATLASHCLEYAENARKDDILSRAKSKMEENKVSSYEEAIRLLKSISGWKDADEQLDICLREMDELKARLEVARLERKRKAEEARLESDRQAEEARLERARQAEINRIESQRRERKAKFDKRVTNVATLLEVVFAIIMLFILFDKTHLGYDFYLEHFWEANMLDYDSNIVFNIDAKLYLYIIGGLVGFALIILAIPIILSFKKRECFENTKLGEEVVNGGLMFIPSIGCGALALIALILVGFFDVAESWNVTGLWWLLAWIPAIFEGLLFGILSILRILFAVLVSFVVFGIAFLPSLLIDFITPLIFGIKPKDY